MQTVPHLKTALTGPLEKIEETLLSRQAEIEQWFRTQWLEYPAPFYASVDLRNAGFKVAPVDTNLFPAGFNNLNPAFLPICVHAAQSAVERIMPAATKILIIIENHTRNTFYLENAFQLQQILEKAGFESRIGSLSSELTEPTTLETANGNQLNIEPTHREEDLLKTSDGFTPCIILLNNDLSGGIPERIQGLEKQAITPPAALGWTQRIKSGHFSYYSEVAREFGRVVGIDPWLIDPLFRNCGSVDFKTGEGQNCLIKHTGALLEEIRHKYERYGIEKPPYAVIKSDAGTYGMSIMTVTSTDELEQLNRKQRKKMASAKEGNTVNKVIIQEGVYTNETWGDGASAEPVVYMMDHFVIGGFYRVHKSKGDTDNLNAPGMHFEALAFAETCSNPDEQQAPDAEPNRFYAYGVIARLALLAAAREIAAINNPEEEE